MSIYEVTMQDRSVERITDADAYQQEGQMTTFFQTGSHRQVVDTWSTRVASFRTSDVVIIRRVEADLDGGLVLAAVADEPPARWSA